VWLLPEDRQEALNVRFMDRFFDNYIMEAMQKPVMVAIKTPAALKDVATQEALDEARKPPGIIEWE
jgi:glutathione S-transferase